MSRERIEGGGGGGGGGGQGLGMDLEITPRMATTPTARLRRKLETLTLTRLTHAPLLVPREKAPLQVSGALTTMGYLRKRGSTNRT